MNKQHTTANKAIYPILFGFFIMGFVDVVGIATNYVKVDFTLSDAQANLLPMMVFLWFALFSIPTGLLMGKIGQRNTVSIALLITALAMLLPLFAYHFIVILLAFALLGIGNTLLQVSLNPMVAQTIHPSKLTSVLTLGQFVKAISSFLGPIVAGIAASYFGNWKLIFAVYTITTVLSIGWLLLAIPDERLKQEQHTTFRTTLSLFTDRHIALLFFGILCVVGIDVGLNTSIPRLLIDKANLPLSEASLGTSLYFAARTTGTFAGAFLLTRFAPTRFLQLSMGIAITGLLILLYTDTLWIMFTMIILIGMACANVFSILFSFALQHNPTRSNEISALMIMGISGGALVPPIMGVVTDVFGQTSGFMVLLACMLYLGIYSINRNK